MVNLGWPKLKLEILAALIFAFSLFHYTYKKHKYTCMTLSVINIRASLHFSNIDYKILNFMAVTKVLLVYITVDTSILTWHHLTFLDMMFQYKILKQLHISH